MVDYIAPISDMRFVLRELVDVSALTRLSGHADFSIELADAVLAEAGKFASGVLVPLNSVGDRIGASCQEGAVTTAPGWRAAYDAFTSGGWNGLSCAVQYGGQGLPRVLSAMVDEMWNSANMAFALCPMLTRAAIEAVELAGSEVLKQAYMARLISGEWTGTMNLTEPQAGSDLAAISTRAVPQSDGIFRLHGQKIFITYGDHDLTDNIVHMVLARCQDAPAGVKGLSLFLVPKYLTGPEGGIGGRNDVECVSIEHKLGIRGSPTATLAFGSRGAGAVGYLVGELNRGLEYMFIMMNAARFAVGVEGIGISQRAYELARSHARERVQGAALGTAASARVAIVQHPDVLRMLLTMKAKIEAMRALAAVVAAALDNAHGNPDQGERRRAQQFADLMIPVVKGWSTEDATEICSVGLQVHGGMGYVEETGAAQLLRDARITSIYEGTTGIQANDLTGRKILRDNGQVLQAMLSEMTQVRSTLIKSAAQPLNAIAVQLGQGIDALHAGRTFLVEQCNKDPRRAAAVAVPFLQLLGVVAGGWQMARAAIAATARLDTGTSDPEFCRAKIATALVYAEHVLPSAVGLSATVCGGSDAVLQYDVEHL